VTRVLAVVMPPVHRAAGQTSRAPGPAGSVGNVAAQLAAAPGGDPAPEERLRDIEAIADAALSRLEAPTLLRELLERIRSILGTDTAAVLLLDRGSGELVATAASGIEEQTWQGARVPVGRGFAGRVAAERRPVMLPEVTGGGGLPTLVARGIRSLLAVPLLAGGKVLGVLHVGSVRRRVFTAEETALLQLAADRAALAVQSMASQHDRMAAVALQRGLLPAGLPAVPGFEIAARYLTGEGMVGGDWYDVFVLPSGELSLVIGDVAGSGLPAAVIMGRMRSALRAYALEAADPGDVLRKLDSKIQYFEAEAMATVLYAVCETAGGELRVSSAGHLPPVLAVPGQRPGPAEIAVDPPIGVADDPRRRSSLIRLPPGGLLCLYTDGLVERRDRPLDDGIAALAEALGRAGGEGQEGHGADGACGAVMDALIGAEAPADDIALLILRREAPAPAAPPAARL
jgi:sigma-B regulation protein RsbU (phosphoserine phosphatase)